MIVWTNRVDNSVCVQLCYNVCTCIMHIRHLNQLARYIIDYRLAMDCAIASSKPVHSRNFLLKLIIKIHTAFCIGKKINALGYTNLGKYAW